MQDSNLRPQEYESCALPLRQCAVNVLSGHTVLIRVPPDKVGMHHLNALTGNGLSPVFLSVPIVIF